MFSARHAEHCLCSRLGGKMFSDRLAERCLCVSTLGATVDETVGAQLLGEQFVFGAPFRTF